MRPELAPRSNGLSSWGTLARPRRYTSQRWMFGRPKQTTLFAGYDTRRKNGRLWKFDITGGRYEESEFDATGSGGFDAALPGVKGESVTGIVDLAVASVRDGAPAMPDFRTALRAHVVVDAAYRSAAQGGAPVEVDSPG